MDLLSLRRLVISSSSLRRGESEREFYPILVSFLSPRRVARYTTAALALSRYAAGISKRRDALRSRLSPSLFLSLFCRLHVYIHVYESEMSARLSPLLARALRKQLHFVPLLPYSSLYFWTCSPHTRARVPAAFIFPPLVARAASEREMREIRAPE